MNIRFQLLLLTAKQVKSNKDIFSYSLYENITKCTVPNILPYGYSELQRPLHTYEVSVHQGKCNGGENITD